jgi:predicted nucleic acid-binding protein
VIVVDTGVLYSYFVADDPQHHQVAAVLESPGEVCIVSPFVTAELDYFVLRRFGLEAEVAMLDELLDGAYELPTLSRLDLASCREVVSHYADKRIGVTDASLVVMADRFSTHRIATFDRRHFAAVRGLDGRPFELLP